MVYETPTAEKIEFEAQDVVTASGENTCPGKSNNKNSGQGQGCKVASSLQCNSGSSNNGKGSGKNK